MLETWKHVVAFYGTFLHLSNNGEEGRNLLITPPCGELLRTIYWDALLQHSLSNLVMLFQNARVVVIMLLAFTKLKNKLLL